MAQSTPMAPKAHPGIRIMLFLLLSGATPRSRAGAEDAPDPSRMEPHDALEVIAALGRMPHGRGAPALRDALQAGLPDKVADAALSALGDQGGPVAFDTLLEFSRHRRPAARAAAYRALAHGFSGDPLRAALARGLGDAHPAVRDTCAALLAVHGDAQAVARLLSALDRGVFGAARAIGALADEPGLSAFAKRLDDLPLPVMLDGYRTALRRPALSADVKVRLIAQLEARGTPAVRAFLQRVLIGTDWSNAPQVREALTQAIPRLPQSTTEVTP